MARNIRYLPVVLFFYQTDITQEQAQQAQEHWDNVDVHFRLNKDGNQQDILEKFDGLAGKPPLAYIAAANEKSLPFVNCTMAEVAAGTAGTFDGLTPTNGQARIANFAAPVSNTAGMPIEQSGTETTTLAAPTSTIQAPTSGAALTDVGNPSTGT